MGLRQIFVYTHDSVGLGEDGPTHQPIEQLTNLRTTPNLMVWRPCDVVETAIAWRESIARKDGPTALILTRQKTQPQARDTETFENISKGGYILRKESNPLQLILLATGSEVEVAQMRQTRWSRMESACAWYPCRVSIVLTLQPTNIKRLFYHQKFELE